MCVCVGGGDAWGGTPAGMRAQDKARPGSYGEMAGSKIFKKPGMFNFIVYFYFLILVL